MSKAWIQTFQFQFAVFLQPAYVHIQILGTNLYFFEEQTLNHRAE